MTLIELIKATDQFAISLMPETFLHGGKSYAGSITETVSKGSEEIEGLMGMADCTLTVSKGVLVASPAIGERITIRGKAMRVAGVSEDGAGSCWTITLVGVGKK